MKTNSFKLRNIATGLLATLLTITVPATAAQKERQAEKAALQPAVQFLGSEANYSLFSVKMGNEKPEKFEITIRDSEGSVLFRETYEAAALTKTFKLVNYGADNNSIDLTFEVRELSTGINHTYEITSSSVYVRNVEVSKL